MVRQEQGRRLANRLRCHPEPGTRFQRVKRGMNRRHVGCCKQGVAEGMLVAIMVVGSRPGTPSLCYPLPAASPRQLGANGGCARATYAEGPHPDECADPSRAQ